MIQNPYPSIDFNALHPYGVIRRTHGHQGNVIISVLGESLFQLDPQFLFIVIDEIPIPFEVEEMRGSKEQLITTFKHIETLTKAEKLVGYKVLIHEDELSGIDDSESISDLIGYDLYHPTLQKVGTILHLDDSTSNLLLTIETPDGSSIMIPMVDEWVVDINSQSRRLTLDFPEELLEL